MDFAWFIYTVTLMVVMVVACATGVVSWVLTNRRDSLAAAATFLIYALETSIILFDEYIRAKPLGVDYINQGLTHPAFEIVVRSAFVVAIWLWVLLRFHVHMRRSAVCLCSLGYLCLSALAAPIGEQAGVLRTMLYWGLCDIALIGVFVWLGWRYLSTPSEHERADMGRHLPFFVTALVLSLLMLCEDLINITMLRPDTSVAWVGDLMWHLTERNLSENLLMLVLAFGSVRETRDVMRVFARHPAHDATTLDHERVRPVLESRLLAFSDAHGLSKREREVLSLLLQGKDIQNISSELVISTGTVKAHLHRIYRKAGVVSGQDLIGLFWRE